jgi:hypothetical protein
MTLGAVSVLALVGAPSGCSSAGSSSSKAPAHTAVQTVTSTVRVVNDIHAQISASGVLGIEGSYHSCAGQADGTSWVLDTAGNAGFMEDLTGLAAPSVELNDTNCALQIDSINTSSIGYTSTDQPTALVFTGPSATPNAYLANAVGFDNPSLDAGNSLSFYANAQSTITAASGSFALTILVGDGPNAGSSSTTATPSVVTGSVSPVADVPVPNYTTDFSSFVLQDDFNGVVATVSGTVNLDFGTQAGETYLAFPGEDLSTDAFAQVDALFNAGVDGDTAIPTGNDTVSVPATSLLAVGNQLPETSSIVVRHIDSTSNVTTYEVLAVTFNPHTGP